MGIISRVVAVRSGSCASRNALSAVVGLGLAMFGLGCGYGFQGAKTTLPSEVRKVYIPQVENASPESGFGPILTDAIRDRFERFGAVTVVDSRSEADAVLEATVTKVKRSTRTTTGRTDRALQYDTAVTVNATLKKINGTTLWSNPQMVVTKAFGGTANSVIDSSADFAEGNLTAADLSGLSSQEVLRTQQGSSLRSVASEVARKIYAAAVVGDF
jgi:hypothetical protein